MRVLATGGAGFVGSHVARTLHDGGHFVQVLDDFSSGHREAIEGLPAVLANLNDSDALERIMGEGEFDAVMHFAGHIQVGESTREPLKYYRNNVTGMQTLLEMMRRHGIGKFVFSSTAAIFGDPAALPIGDDAPTAPVNPYGRGKLVGEWMLADCAEAYGMGYVALRYFNASGASADGRFGEDHKPESHLIPLALAAAMGTIPKLSLFGDDYDTPDGTCVRDYIHIDDLAAAHLLALEFVEPGQTLACNLGTGRGWSNRQVIRTCEEISQSSIPIEVAPRRSGDPPVLIAGSDRARRVLGWEPKCDDLTEIARTAWGWHSSHPQGYSTITTERSGDSPETLRSSLEVELL